MIPSNSALFQALEKQIIIDPEPAPRNPRDDPNSEWPYATPAVDLRLGDEVSWFNEGLASNIDLRRGTFANLFGPHSSSRKISADQPYALMSGSLFLPTRWNRLSCLSCQEGQRWPRAWKAAVLRTLRSPRPLYGSDHSRRLRRANHARAHQPRTDSDSPLSARIRVSTDCRGSRRRAERNDSQFQGQSRPGGL